MLQKSLAKCKILDYWYFLEETKCRDHVSAKQNPSLVKRGQPGKHGEKTIDSHY